MHQLGDVRRNAAEVPTPIPLTRIVGPTRKMLESGSAPSYACVYLLILYHLMDSKPLGVGGALRASGKDLTLKS